MENRVVVLEDVAVLEVSYKKKSISVHLDHEDVQVASSISGRWILVRKSKEETPFYFVCNRDKSIYLHKLILEASPTDSVYFLDKDYTNLRKSNLSLNTYPTDEKFRELRKEAYRHISTEGKENWMNGVQLHRYSKEWSDKLSSAKLGTHNVKTVLNESVVRKIREEYALNHVTQVQLAQMYAVGRTTIGDIVNYRTWNEVGENQSKQYRVYEEKQIFELNLEKTPIQPYDFTNQDILQDEFVLHFVGMHTEEYIFVQKIGKIKLYIEVRNEYKEFYHCFEVVFPEFITNLHIHNYVITHRRPVRHMNRHQIHFYMQLISTFLFGQSHEEGKNTEISDDYRIP